MPSVFTLEGLSQAQMDELVHFPPYGGPLAPHAAYNVGTTKPSTFVYNAAYLATDPWPIPVPTRGPITAYGQQYDRLMATRPQVNLNGAANPIAVATAAELSRALWQQESAYARFAREMDNYAAWHPEVRYARDHFKQFSDRVWSPYFSSWLGVEQGANKHDVADFVNRLQTQVWPAAAVAGAPTATQIAIQVADASSGFAGAWKTTKSIAGPLASFAAVAAIALGFGVVLAKRSAQ